jgi:hypothetical protein
MSDSIEITEVWRVVDRWWTDEPLDRYYAALRSPDLEIDLRARVCWDSAKKEWSLIVESEPEAKSDE